MPSLAVSIVSILSDSLYFASLSTRPRVVRNICIALLSSGRLSRRPFVAVFRLFAASVGAPGAAEQPADRRTRLAEELPVAVRLHGHHPGLFCSAARLSSLGIFIAPYPAARAPIIYLRPRHGKPRHIRAAPARPPSSAAVERAGAISHCSLKPKFLSMNWESLQFSFTLTQVCR